MGHPPELGSAREELWRLVRQVPRGRVTSYGALGRALRRPVSGLIVGKWMAAAPDGVAWWRVVAADGRLVVGRRDPLLGLEQRERLIDEGVRFTGEMVAAEAFFDVEIDAEHD